MDTIERLLSVDFKGILTPHDIWTLPRAFIEDLSDSRIKRLKAEEKQRKNNDRRRNRGTTRDPMASFHPDTLRQLEDSF